MVERERELTDLHEAAWRAAKGTPNVVVITGEAGAGKSRLAGELISTLGDACSSTVLRASAADSRPIGPLGELVPGLDRGTEWERAGEALAGELQRRSEDGLHVVVVEDIHWLNPTAVGVFGMVLSQLDGVEVLVVMTYRLGEHPLGHPVAAAITRLLQDHDATEMRLPLLGPAGVAAMAEEITGVSDTDRDAQLYRRSGGNPLYVEALLGATGVGALPWTLAQAVHERLKSLPAPARRVAMFLGLAGSPVPAPLLAELDDPEGGIAALVVSGLAVRQGSDVELHHALIGEALVDELEPGERAHGHRQLAEAFASCADGAPDRVAHHLAAAGEYRQAAAVARDAADRFHRTGNYQGATDMYRLALAAPGDSAEHAQLLREAAVAAALAGETADARAWGEGAQLVELTNGDGSGKPATWLNPALRQPGVQPGHTDHHASLRAAQAAVEAGDLRTGQALARHAALAALETGDVTAMADAGLTVGYAGDAATGSALVDRAVEAARRGKNALDTARVLAIQARMAWVAGHGDLALASDQQALAVARSVPGAELWPHLQAGVALILAGRGELDEAARLARELADGERPFAAALARVPLAIVAMESGDLPFARAALEPMLPGTRALGIDYFTVQLLGVLARLELLDGHPRQCLLLLDEAEHTAWSPHHEGRGDVLYLRGRALARLGDRDGLSGAADAASDLARHATGPGIVPVADALAGLRAQVAGDLNEAQRRLTAAALAWERVSRRIFAAEAWLLGADVAIRQGALGTAREALTRAAELATNAGASRLAEAAKVGLEKVVDPVVGRGVPVAELTARELDVVQLAAVGHTNSEIGAQLFLSPTTVRNYLSTAFTKLGVQRRSQLAAIVFGGDAAPADAAPTTAAVRTALA